MSVHFGITIVMACMNATHCAMHELAFKKHIEAAHVHHIFIRITSSKHHHVNINYCLVPKSKLMLPWIHNLILYTGVSNSLPPKFLPVFCSYNNSSH